MPDQIPYVESGTYVAYNNEKGGVIQSLKDDGMIDDLDSAVRNTPEWASTKAMAESWLADALLYELWLGSDASSVQIYYSDLPWPIGKLLYFKQVHVTKQRLGITKENADKREEEVSSNFFFILVNTACKQARSNIPFGSWNESKGIGIGFYKEWNRGVYNMNFVPMFGWSKELNKKLYSSVWLVLWNAIPFFTYFYF